MVQARDKMPWFDAVCVILPQLPYLRQQCLRREYRGHLNLLQGFCYAASEAIHHLSEDPTEPWMIRYGNRPHQTHWFLKLTETGERIDVTASQFSDMDSYAMYDREKRHAFGTKYPSKRAQCILDRIDRRAYWQRTYGDYTFEHATKRYENALKKRKAENSNPTPRSARSG